MKNANFGFTLIELLIVVAIIGILAAVALPYYQGHMVGARLTEVTNAMGNVATAVSAYVQEKEGTSWPDCPGINEIQSSLGVSLRALTRIGGMSVSTANGVITATVQNIHPMVNGKTLTLTPAVGLDGSLRWNWGWSADFPVQFRPKG